MYRQPSSRGQSSVVGVALLVGITMLALGTMAMAVGGVVDDATTDADIRRVAGDFDHAFRSGETARYNSAPVAFGDGSLSTAPRTIRVLNSSGVVARYDTRAVVYESPRAAAASRGPRVTALGGAIFVTHGSGTAVTRRPQIATGPGVLVLGVPVVHDSESIGGTRVRVTVETRLTHVRRTLGNDTWRYAVETTTPDAWNRTLRERGASIAAYRDLDGDGHRSVIARFPGNRTLHVIRHDVQLEVRQ